jgi:hypothetical protein
VTLHHERDDSNGDVPSSAISDQETVSTNGKSAGCLLPQHLADLRKSGLLDETIVACQFRTVDGAEVNLLLGWKAGANNLGPCLKIPFLDRQGQPTNFARLKPDRPRLKKNRKGEAKPVKYEQPKSASIRLYVPPMAWRLIDDPTVPLIITEGEKKAGKAAQEGFACVGLTGVECWSVARKKDATGKPIGKRTLLHDLLALPLKGRIVVIIFDSDADTNRNVRRAERALAKALRQAGAIVRVVRLPADEGGGKMGLDDYLCRHSADDLRRLIGACGNQDSEVTDRLQAVLDAGGPESLFLDATLLQDLANLEGEDTARFASALALARRERVSVRNLTKVLRQLRPQHAAPAKGIGQAGYFEESGCICRNAQTKDGPLPVALCNFTARIKEDIVHDDGAEQSRCLAVEGTLSSGEPLPRAEVPATDFPSTNWIVPAWGTQAVVFAGQGNKDHLRAALQLLSGNVPRRTIYSHLGWRKIGDEWLFLHAGGGIAANGLHMDVPVLLPDGLAGFSLPAALAPVPLRAQIRYGDLGQAAQRETDELIEAVRASLRLLKLGPAHVMVPLLAAVYRTVLGDTDFGLHLVGPTGCYKSEAAALAQQHYGAGMDRPHLPANWSSTANALEALAFAAKDSLLVVDDFCPTGSTADVQRYHKEADRLFRGQGNRAGRQRMRADGSLRPQKPPRGLILSTGEDTPRGQSLRARLLVLEISPGDFGPPPPAPNPTLTACQKDATTGKYAVALAGFIRWLASQYDAIRSRLRTELVEFRNKASQVGLHARTPGIVADLALGLRYLLDFAQLVGAITTQERAELWDRGWKALGEAAARQAEHVQAAEPCGHFLRLLAAALASGRAHVAGPDGGPPANAAAWGWREGQPGSGAFAPEGRRIGWVDGQSLYLEPEAAHAEAQRLASEQGETLAIGAGTLRKRLKEGGYLASTETTREVLTVRRVLEKSRRDVLHLRATSLLCGQPDQPDQSPDNSEENGLVAGRVTGRVVPDSTTNPTREPDQNAEEIGPVVGLAGSDVGGGGTGGDNPAISNGKPLGSQIEESRECEQLRRLAEDLLSCPAPEIEEGTI